jgi:hypothetical protein
MDCELLCAAPAEPLFVGVDILRVVDLLGLGDAALGCGGVTPQMRLTRGLQKAGKGNSRVGRCRTGGVVW